MNTLKIRVHTPSGVGEATLSRAEIVNSKFLNNEQKEMLLHKMGYESVTYLGDKYFQIAETKKVEVTESKLYWNPDKNKYVQVDNQNVVGYVTDVFSTTAVAKNNKKYLLW